MFQSVEDFYQRFYFRAPTIASKMVRSPEMMKRRPREGIEFLKFLRQRGPMGYRLRSLAMLLVAALASSVKAADITVPPPQPAPPGWIITAGADARAVPRYMGSNASAIVPVPYFDVRRPGSQEGFHAPRDGTGIALFDNGVLAIGPVGSLIWQA